MNAATLGGLTRAAERMGVSKSIASRRLAKLEAELGARLVTRTTRGLSLTEAGSEFLIRAQSILAAADDAKLSVAGRVGELAGRLRLAVPLSFGVKHLAPALAEFAAAHPRLSLDVSYGDHVHDIIAQGFDAAVRIGVLGSSTLVARRIATLRAVIAASPAYLARHGMLTVPHDLGHHEVLIYAGSRDPGTWTFGEKPSAVSVRVAGRIRADSGEALCAAAVAGLGIGLFPAFMVYRELLSGALVPILKDHPLPVLGLHLVRPPGPVTTKLSMLSDFLVERFGTEQPWDVACRSR